MTTPALDPAGRDSTENRLLASLGLPPSTSPDELDDLHLAVSEYLAAAPSSISGWAHAQAAALDAAYLTLTDPVGLQGSALRSPAEPPAVVPGGPATPPARRGQTPGSESAVVEPVEADAATDDDALDDLDALYASVTPSAHDDMKPDPTRPRKAVAQPKPVVVTGGRRRPRRAIVVGLGAVLLVAAIAVGGNLAGGGTRAASVSSPSASQGTPAVDQQKVGELMQKLAANPKDTTTLLALADTYYAAEQYTESAGFLDKLLAVEPKNVEALLARGATSFNLGDLPAAEKTWKQVVALKPDNAEVHYDLGFLYLNEQTPDWAAVQAEWTKVIEIDPTSDLAKTVKAHLESLAKASMIPGSPAPSGAAASPVASAAASAAASAPAASSAVASPAASAAGSARP